MKIQNNLYYPNNNYLVQNKKQAPSFEKRDETKYTGTSLLTEEKKGDFNRYIDSSPAVTNFFNKYDGDFVICIDDDSYAQGSLMLRYTHPLHPDNPLLPIEIIYNIYGNNSNDCLDKIISEVKKVNENEKVESLSHKNWPSGPDGHDHLSYILNCLDRNIQEDIEAQKELQVKEEENPSTKQTKRWFNWPPILFKKS